MEAALKFLISIPIISGVINALNPHTLYVADLQPAYHLSTWNKYFLTLGHVIEGLETSLHEVINQSAR